MACWRGTPNMTAGRDKLGNSGRENVASWLSIFMFAATLALIGGCRHEARPTAKIVSFRGEYQFLSNFFPANVEFEGIRYPSVEHAYQSAKTLDMNERRRIAAIKDPGEAKRAGRALKYRDDWETAKFDVMERCVGYKFTHNPELKSKLLATGDAHLEERNTWGDQIWGTVNGVGENRLGKILMKVRSELVAASAGKK
jgi:N-glycosidase YbiA